MTTWIGLLAMRDPQEDPGFTLCRWCGQEDCPGPRDVDGVCVDARLEGGTAQVHLAEAKEAFEALAPYATEEDSYSVEPVDAGACASHDALNCPLCGWLM